MSGTPNAVRPSRAEKRETAEQNATIGRMAETVVDAILARGTCEDRDLERAMFTGDEIKLHKEAAMRLARQDERVRDSARAA
ncbi:hypothetical protein sos41_11490 [Alphaproteobacteria bacterium SO-S41]|nr:hypothetical protein sos41_11490 [Alphaproteobacteria bacterium SO-S41]